MTKNNFFRKVYLILIAGLFLSGCGYTTRSLVSNKFRTIHIAQFVNKIDITLDTDTGNKYKINRPMLESEVTKAVINKYLFDGNLKPVNSDSADVVLKGEVIEFKRDPVRWTEDNNEVEEYRMSIVVNISLWNKKDNIMLWQENGFTGTTTYYTSFAAGDLVRKSESAAVNDAVTDLARRIVERTVEEW